MSCIKETFSCCIYILLYLDADDDGNISSCIKTSRVNHKCSQTNKVSGKIHVWSPHIEEPEAVGKYYEQLYMKYPKIVFQWRKVHDRTLTRDKQWHALATNALHGNCAIRKRLSSSTPVCLQILQNFTFTAVL